MSPPRPVISGSTRPWTAHAASAASTALPPDCSIRTPISEASACPDATMPLSERMGGRHVWPPPPTAALCWPRGEAENVRRIATAMSQVRRVIPYLPARAQCSAGCALGVDSREASTGVRGRCRQRLETAQERAFLVALERNSWVLIQRSSNAGGQGKAPRLGKRRRRSINLAETQTAFSDPPVGGAA